MKHSIRFKITFALTLMVVLIIGITWFINNTFLSNYYIYTKAKNLELAFEEVVNIYNNSTSTGYLSEEDTEKMERLALKLGVEINVINRHYLIIYPSSDYYGIKEANTIFNILMEYRFPGSNIYMENVTLQKETEDYEIYRLYDRQMDSNYMHLLGFFDNPVDNEINVEPGRSSQENNTQSDSSDQAANGTDGNIKGENKKPSNKGTGKSDGNENEKSGKKPTVDTIVLIRTNLESIEESSDIANTFLAYVGIASIIIGSIAMFIISKKFTKPILDLSTIAKRMTDLDFDVKYTEKSKDEFGELGKSINTLSDKLKTTITELKHANNELMTDIQRKIEIDEMRKEFLSNVSHELKTPLALIQGYAEGLKENIHEDEESRDFYCEVIIDEANKMNQMVKKLLSLNEIEFGNNQVNFERFDIVALIRSVLNSTEILFKQKEVTLHFEQSEPVYVWADEYLIEQVVTNYISNALNHVKGQNIIEIKLIPRNSTVRVAVFNTGDNIPEEDLDKIWIKFYKVDKARTREYGGSGIGLSIVKAIMNSHNRECGVINRPIGVEFWFELDAKS